MIALAKNAFAVVWDSDRQAGSGFGIHGRLYNAAAAPAGPEFPITPTAPSGAPSSSSAAPLGNGGFVVTWISGDDVNAQRFSAGGSKLGTGHST